MIQDKVCSKRFFFLQFAKMSKETIIYFPVCKSCVIHFFLTFEIQEKSNLIIFSIYTPTESYIRKRISSNNHIDTFIYIFI